MEPFTDREMESFCGVMMDKNGPLFVQVVKDVVGLVVSVLRSKEILLYLLGIEMSGIAS